MSDTEDVETPEKGNCQQIPFVSFFLETYATNDIITEVEARIIVYKQPGNKYLIGRLEALRKRQ